MPTASTARVYCEPMDTHMAHEVLPPAHMLARSVDPSTSKAAAATVRCFASEQYGDILNELSVDRPMGAEQIAKSIGLMPYQVRKRLPELEKAGLAKVMPGETRRTGAGRLERLWLKVARQGGGA